MGMGEQIPERMIDRKEAIVNRHPYVLPQSSWKFILRKGVWGGVNWY